MDSSIFSLYRFFIYFPFKTLGCISLLSGYYLCHLDLHWDKKMFITEIAVSPNENAPSHPPPPTPRYPAMLIFFTGREAAEKSSLSTKTLSEYQHPNCHSWW